MLHNEKTPSLDDSGEGDFYGQGIIGIDRGKMVKSMAISLPKKIKIANESNKMVILL